MDKFIGSRLDGRYEITELIGEGGMAEVYKAHDVLDNKVVAVKILKAQFAGNEEFLRRFRNESKAISVLSHPNIVKVYDMCFSEKLQYIVMEYIDGITLKDYIDSERVLNWKDAVHFIIQILRALQNAHNRGIVHRDIKPQNIMLLTDGTIKVMDFGIAKFAREESMTATDQAIGTVHYISPEQARGDVTDEKSDIYSVGVMFYEMLTGQKPFDTDSPISIAVMHIRNVAQRPRDINPNIPSGLEEIIMHAMEKDAEVRYQTATDMIHDIEAFKNNNQIVFGYYRMPAQQQSRQYTAAPPREQVQPDYRNQQQPEYYDNGEYDTEEDEEWYGYEEEPARQKSMLVPILTSVTIVVVVICAVIVVAIIAGAWRPGSEKLTTIPDLVGMPYEDAVEIYEDSLVLNVEKEAYNDKYAEGMIYDQSIAAGQEIQQDADGKVRVAIAVSQGTQKHVIPELTNVPESEAIEQLDAMGFTVRKVSEESTMEAGIEKGMVIRTEPKAGTEAEAGQTIVLYVSAGIAVDEVTVPELVGKTLEEVEIEAAHLNLKLVVEEVESAEPEGTILEQDIEAGEIVVSGKEIHVKVSTGVAPEGEVTFGLYLPSIATGRYTLDFSIDGEIVESYAFVTESTDGMVVVTLKERGTKTVVVSITGTQSGLTSRLGTYTFDFTAGGFTAQSENIDAGFEAVTIMPTTEAPPVETQIVTVTEIVPVEPEQPVV
ncbi:MAG: Stk1 family PASTA domain-containing Ser/Thr kinase [Ruminococcus sp.]|nr:Stk1 family PASTA domain-containing Ser/Thr kinase [Ruminococcus sp.]